MSEGWFVIIGTVLGGGITAMMQARLENREQYRVLQGKAESIMLLIANVAKWIRDEEANAIAEHRELDFKANPEFVVELHAIVLVYFPDVLAALEKLFPTIEALERGHRYYSLIKGQFYEDMPTHERATAWEKKLSTEDHIMETHERLKHQINSLSEAVREDLHRQRPKPFPGF